MSTDMINYEEIFSFIDHVSWLSSSPNLESHTSKGILGLWYLVPNHYMSRDMINYKDMFFLLIMSHDQGQVPILNPIPNNVLKLSHVNATFLFQTQIQTVSIFSDHLDKPINSLGYKITYVHLSQSLCVTIYKRLLIYVRWSQLPSIKPIS